MVKKIEPLSNWITAEKASQLLSDKLGFPIEPRYIRQMARRKKKPVRTEPLGYHQLYHRDDILASKVKRRTAP
jgi:hypothetical protein